MSVPDARRGAITALAAGLLAASCAGGSGDVGAWGGIGTLGDLLTEVTGGGRVAAGLKEALTVGTRNAVAETSKRGGYLDDPAIRIALPGALDTMARGLRLVGYGAQVDELYVAMNRAAERAAGEATDVFLLAIRQMTIRDAMGILNGGDTAATQYFERTTRDTLYTRFEPIVSEKMDQVGVVRQYDALLTRFDAIPFSKKPNLDLRDYVTNRALDGLFTVLGNEERKIRTDPAARVTPLLREVFQ